ncbi:MAG TPA: YebC/PmpR family DNA-binding transcriptional regulator, partial [Nitrospirae bacterium]|nr:YebC/PmpR family DNA-binding transcriptional regulator [Nitrospirota bacterium]
DALSNAGVKIEMAEITMIPQNSVVLDEQHATQMLKLMDLLEDHDDVQNVFSNFDIPEEVMQKVS